MWEPPTVMQGKKADPEGGEEHQGMKVGADEARFPLRTVPKNRQHEVTSVATSEKTGMVSKDRSGWKSISSSQEQTTRWLLSQPHPVLTLCARPSAIPNIAVFHSSHSQKRKIGKE